jgi:hypothetical protein
MDSTVLSLTCAGLGAAQEDDDGAAIGYIKGEHCLGVHLGPLFPRLFAFGSGTGVVPISDPQRSGC